MMLITRLPMRSSSSSYSSLCFVALMSASSIICFSALPDMDERPFIWLQSMSGVNVFVRMWCLSHSISSFLLSFWPSHVRNPASLLTSSTLSLATSVLFSTSLLGIDFSSAALMTRYGSLK